MEFSTKEIRVNGLNFNVLDEGKGQPVLLLHGYPDSLKAWRKVVPLLLEKGYRVIAFDQRGFGETDAPVSVEEYRIENIVNDVVSILAALKVNSKIRLIGHDWGSNIGWAFSMAYPQMVESYVAISVGHPMSYFNDGGFEQTKKGWYIMASLFEGRAESMFSANDWALFRMFSDNNPEADENWIPDLERPGRFTAALNWYRANFDPKYAGPTEKEASAPVKVPVLGIYGTNDLYLSKAQMVNSEKYIAAKFSYYEMEGAGHWIQMERSEELVQAVEAFYKSI